MTFYISQSVIVCVLLGSGLDGRAPISEGWFFREESSYEFVVADPCAAGEWICLQSKGNLTGDTETRMSAAFLLLMSVYRGPQTFRGTE